MLNSMRSVAESILRENDRGLYTIPSARLYPHQWAWDSAFAAVGWAHLDPERACLEIETLLAGQWEDGRVPHILFHQDTPDYFPGPVAWGAGGSSSITNPPVWTLAAEKLLDLGVNKDRLRAWLPALERSHQFLSAHRDPLGWNVIATAHPWENGQDNCPAWDEPLLAVAAVSAGGQGQSRGCGSTAHRPSVQAVYGAGSSFHRKRLSDGRFRGLRSFLHNHDDLSRASAGQDERNPRV